MTALIRLAARRLRRRSGPDLRNEVSARGRCITESSALIHEHSRKDTGVALALFVRARGQRFRREHWAVIEWTDETAIGAFPVVDVTARQFQYAVPDPIPVPWTGTLLDWYAAVHDWFGGDALHVEVYPRDPTRPQGIADDPIWRDAYTPERMDA